MSNPELRDGSLATVHVNALNSIEALHPPAEEEGQEGWGRGGVYTFPETLSRICQQHTATSKCQVRIQVNLAASCRYSNMRPRSWTTQRLDVEYRARYLPFEIRGSCSKLLF